VERGDIRSDLQMHSTWSDGNNSVLEMAEACRDLGHDYMAITDHGGEITIANGLDLDSIRKQKEEIEEARKKAGIGILHGLEANIQKDGKLDIGKKEKEEVDLVLGAIHSAFRMDRNDMTERLVTAVGSGDFHILAHPTARMLQERKGIDVDMDKVFEAAADTGTIMEINAYPKRLDLGGYHVKRAIEAGVKISIGTDSHRSDHLRYIDLGVATARRGWATKDDIVNTLSLDEFKKLISGIG
jgi:DNA polymerase (family 10)